MAEPSRESTFEDLLRTLAPQVLGVLVRRHGQFAECEDAVQEALLEAALQWPASGVPDNPRSWLLTVATRRLVDYWRSESARQAREQRAAAMEPPPGEDPSSTSEPEGFAEDTLTLLFLCCHPALSAPSQLALTLRAVGGLTTAEIASAFFVPEATMGQRISRAKQSIKKAGAHFELPETGERQARLGVVLHVLYLIFNEGYAASSGPSMQREDLTAEAIRLARLLRGCFRASSKWAGCWPSCCSPTHDDGRGPSRTGCWCRSRNRIAGCGTRPRSPRALNSCQQCSGRPSGPYQLQAAIAAVHAEASSADQTDWPQILALYTVLEAMAPSPVVALNRAVAVAMVEGPRAALQLLCGLGPGWETGTGSTPFAGTCSKWPASLRAPGSAFLPRRRRRGACRSGSISW
ncbi:uncharacterized protein R00370 [Arthrobacter sp. Hiyo8]|nr:uncharacterized protein R00370 [Arthrobacter sp. Hiyo8]